MIAEIIMILSRFFKHFKIISDSHFDVFFYRPPAERVVREDSSSSSTVDIFKQRFSVCCHPRLPLFLCSDGYMVTCLQLPQSLSDPLSFIRTISQQAYKYMHLLRKLLRSPEDCLEAKDKTIPLTTSFYKSSIKLSHFDVLNTTEFASRDTRHIDDEEQSSESDSTSHLLSENLVHRISAVGTHDSGTLIFGTQSKEGQLTPHINNNNDFSLEKILAVVEKEATVCIFRIWGIMVTYSGPWTIEWEMEAKVAAELLLKLCSRLINLYSGNVLKHHRSFEKIFSLVNSWLSTCHFNALDKTVMVLILNTVKELLKVFRIKIAELPVRRRIKQSIALFRFLELMEKNVTRSFGQHVDQLLCSSNYSSHQYSQPHFSILSSLKSSDHKSVVKQRFTVVWRIFYKDIWKLYNVTSDNRVALLLGDVQKKFQKLRCSLELNKPKISVNDGKCLIKVLLFVALCG